MSWTPRKTNHPCCMCIHNSLPIPVTCRSSSLRKWEPNNRRSTIRSKCRLMHRKASWRKMSLIPALRLVITTRTRARLLKVTLSWLVSHSRSALANPSQQAATKLKPWIVRRTQKECNRRLMPWSKPVKICDMIQTECIKTNVYRSTSVNRIGRPS